MNYEFPKLEDELVYLLSYIYQEKETFDNLFSDNVLKSVSTLNGKGITYTTESIRDTKGKLRHEKLNRNGSISYTNVKYSKEEIRIVNEQLDIDIYYKFTPSGILIYEEHRSRVDTPSKYHFSINENGFLDRINQYEIIRIDNQIKNIVNRDNNSVIVELISTKNNVIEFVDYEKITKKYVFENNRLTAIYADGKIKYLFEYSSCGNDINTYKISKDGVKHLEINRKLEFSIFGSKEVETFYNNTLLDRKYIESNTYCKYKLDEGLHQINHMLEGDYLSKEVDKYFDYKSNFSNWIGYNPTKGKIGLSIKFEKGVGEYEVNIPIESPIGKGNGLYKIKYGLMYQVDNYLILSSQEIDERVPFCIDNGKLSITLFDRLIDFYKIDAQNKNN